MLVSIEFLSNFRYYRIVILKVDEQLDIDLHEEKSRTPTLERGEGSGKQHFFRTKLSKLKSTAMEAHTCTSDILCTTMTELFSVKVSSIPLILSIQHHFQMVLTAFSSGA